jgi:hypothetical protein
VHKAQGLTLDSVVFDAGTNEHSAGLFFTALTRVRKPSDFAFYPFPSLIRVTDEILRLPDLFKRKQHELQLRRLARSTATALGGPAQPALPDAPDPKARLAASQRAADAKKLLSGKHTSRDSVGSTPTTGKRARADQPTTLPQQAKVQTRLSFGAKDAQGTSKKPMVEARLDETLLEQNRRTLREFGLPQVWTRTELARVGDELPAWLTDSGLRLRARIVDYYAPASEKYDVQAYLERMGFDVKMETSRQQRGSACGIVGVAAAELMARAQCQTAGGWWTAPMTTAADDNHVRVANEQQLHWRSSKELIPASELQRNPLETNPDTNEDLLKLAQLKFESERRMDVQLYPGQSLFPLESNYSWFNLMSLDATLVKIARDVRKVALDAAKAPLPMKCILSNTQCSDRRGFHWFTIAYDIHHEPALASRAVLDMESECDVDMAELEEMWGEVMFD